MARNYANIFTAIWGDPDWRALDERSQRMYLLLATQKNISAAGMLPLTIGRWAGMSSNSTPAKVREALYRLAVARFVAIDEEHEELLVRSFVRHDNGYNNKKRRMVIEASAGDVESRLLRQVLAVELVRLGLPAEWTREEPVELPESAHLGLTATAGEASDSTSDHRDSPPVDNPADDAFSQVDRPYQNPARAIPERAPSDRVVVTEEVVVRTSTHNPHPVPPPAAPSVPDDALDGLFANPAPKTTEANPNREAQNRAYGIARWWINLRKANHTPVVAGGKNGPMHPVRSLIEQFTPHYTDEEIRAALSSIDRGLPAKSALDDTLARMRRSQQARQPALPSGYEPRGTAAHSDHHRRPSQSSEGRNYDGWTQDVKAQILAEMAKGGTR